MRRLLIAAALVLAAGAGGLWLLSGPRAMSAADLPDHAPDPGHGRYVFHAAGCNSCHAAPEAKGEAKRRLGGGLALETPFGTFVAPNVSPHPEDGIGGWSELDFVNAVMRGVAPGGSHYYPAFPYLSYQRMRIEDVLDLKAYMDTLPAVAGRAPGHALPLPLRLRRGLGLWKRLYMDHAPFRPDPDASDQLNRGAYLVTGPGHCGECHTPRTLLGAPDAERAFSGGPAPEGEGTIPNITPHPDGIGDWSVDDIEAALRTGLLPDFDTFGGDMVPVQENMAELTEADREAIAVYLKALPPRPSWWKE
ncbi:MAG TPA: cytochrome c [Thermohalobaculum sp.]|nr:cytochrome c [Thermohalobaculum sp.]